jgi:rubrerythrin
VLDEEEFIPEIGHFDPVNFLNEINITEELELIDLYGEYIEETKKLNLDTKQKNDIISLYSIMQKASNLHMKMVIEIVESLIKIQGPFGKVNPEKMSSDTKKAINMLFHGLYKEYEASQFYDMAAKMVEYPEIKERIDALKKQEIQHAKLFIDMLKTM